VDRPKHSGPPTEPVTAPGDSEIRNAYLPNVGEPLQKPNGQPQDARDQQAIKPHSVESPISASPESMRERFASILRSTVQRASVYGQVALNALVLDDWKALTDAHSTPLQRLEGAADLASWALPEGKVAEIAGHALVKASEISAEHLAHAGIAHTADRVAAAGTIEERWAARSENAKIAAQHFSNPSKIWERPLTETERNGAFKSKDDLTALLGPATEGRGPVRDWHHVVESHTDARFGPERVHTIDNVVAIERNPTHREISKAFQSNDRRLGPGPDGRERSLRMFLQDKSWDRHVAEGELELRKRGLDPEQLRAATRERFDERVKLHDQLVERSIGRNHAAAAPSRERDPFGGSGRSADMLDHAPGRDRSSFTIMRSDAHGVQSLQQMREPFQQHGTIISADAERVTQNIGRGQTFTYKTEDLLQAAKNRDDALQLFKQAAANHELTSIKLGSQGLEVTTQSMEHARGYEYGR
jgi:hypothetical protein